MKQFLLAAALVTTLSTSNSPALAHDTTKPAPQTSPGVAQKVENAIERGVSAAASGVERGVKAAAAGITKGAKAAAHGIERAASATAGAVEKTADKVGLSTAPASSAPGR